MEKKPILSDEQIEWPTPELYTQMIEEAERVAVVLSVRTPSREHSLSMTNLQQARLWDDEGRANREYRQQEREKHPVE